MWVTQTVFVLALWCSLVSGYPTPTIPVHTKLPKREGCIYQGKWYRLNTEISKGGDGNGWSYGVYCNANGKPVRWDQHSTGTTTEPPTFIHEGERHEDNTHPSTGMNEDITSPSEHEGSTTDFEGSTNPTDDRIYTTNIPTSHAEDTTTGDVESTNRPSTEHEGSTNPTRQYKARSEEDITNDSSADSKDTTTGDFENTNRPSTEHEGSTNPIRQDKARSEEDITNDSSADSEDTTTTPTNDAEPSGDYEDAKTVPTTASDKSSTRWPFVICSFGLRDLETTLTFTTELKDPTLVPVTEGTIYGLGCWYEGKRYHSGAFIESKGARKWNAVCLNNGDIWLDDGVNTPPPSITDLLELIRDDYTEPTLTLVTLGRFCVYEGKYYLPGEIRQGSKGPLTRSMICLHGVWDWLDDGDNTGSPSTTETNKESIPRTTASSLIIRRRRRHFEDGDTK